MQSEHLRYIQLPLPLHKQNICIGGLISARKHLHFHLNAILENNINIYICILIN